MQLSVKMKRDSIQVESKSSPKQKPQSKVTISIRRDDVRVITDDGDVTPEKLKPIPKYQIKKSKKEKASLERSQLLDGSTFSPFTSKAFLHTQSHLSQMTYAATSGLPSFGSVIKISDSDLEDVIATGSLQQLDEEKTIGEELKGVHFERPTKPAKMPVKANIILQETPVFYIFDMISETAEKDTEEGAQVIRDNERYEYLTIGKGRNRKMTHSETQTTSNLLKNRATLAQQEKRANNYAFASKWDMFDTFTKDTPPVPKKPKPIPVAPTAPGFQHYLQELDNQMNELLKMPKFQNSLIVMERILANNVYNKEQKRFRGLLAQDPFRPDVEFKYTLDLLWTFKNKTTNGHPITSMHWNPGNHDILAVGYGKFHYTDQKDGFVYCWNIKNPTQPERQYFFLKPVTAVAFSEFNPNWLAVGLYDGMVNVLDISTKDVHVIFKTGPTWSPSQEPVWQIVWLPPDDFHPQNEYLVCVTNDGRVCRLQSDKSNELLATPLMRTIQPEGPLPGIFKLKHYSTIDVPIYINPAALLITKYEANKDMYYIATDEGTVHKCSRNHINQHLSILNAHDGPVYACQFSPFCQSIFLTCGADWCTNIWAEDVTQPLITLTENMEAVEGAAWNPANSTVIASISGKDIFLWDIQRRVYSPASVHQSPTNCRNTVVQFTDSGRNLIVGDVEGNVHVFSLENMPFPPFYQEKMLAASIKKALMTRNEIVHELSKAGVLEFEE